MSTGVADRAGVLGAAALGVELADEAILTAVRDVHQAVVERIRLPHTLSSAVYAGVGTTLRATATGLRAADRLATRAGIARALDESPRGRFTVSALNGLFGDRFATDRPELAITMAIRRAGADVALTRDGLAAAYPAATGDLAVFVHGLSETEDAWRRNAEERGATYADDLAARGWTPLMIRVNTGLTLAENGVALSALLERAVAAWPVDVRRIALVGHSMGGLIARAAGAVHTDQAAPWTDLVTDVVTLGTPHLGAPIARALTAGSAGLARLPESAPFGRFLDHRSAGILDLRRGLPRDVLALPRARYHLVAATLSRSPWHPVAEVAGDLLVRYPSAVARARGRAALFPDADVLHVPNAHHLDLLNHADVAAALLDWLR